MASELLKKVTLTFTLGGIDKSWSARGKKSVDEIVAFLVDEVNDHLSYLNRRVIPVRCDVTEYIPTGLTSVKPKRYTINLIKRGNHDKLIKH